MSAIASSQFFNKNVIFYLQCRKFHSWCCMLPSTFANYTRENNIKQRKKKILKDQSKHWAKMHNAVQTPMSLLKSFYFSRACQKDVRLDDWVSIVFHFRKMASETRISLNFCHGKIINSWVSNKLLRKKLFLLISISLNSICGAETFYFLAQKEKTQPQSQFLSKSQSTKQSKHKSKDVPKKWLQNSAIYKGVSGIFESNKKVIFYFQYRKFYLQILYAGIS